MSKLHTRRQVGFRTAVIVPLLLAALMAPCGGRPSGAGSAWGTESIRLDDPTRPVAVITRDSFTLQYQTSVPCETSVEIRQGERYRFLRKPPRFARTNSEDGAPAHTAGTEKRLFHTLRIPNLSPGVRYFYRVFDPGSEPEQTEQRWGAAPPWRREYAVSTLAAPGRKTVIRLPVNVLLMPNVLNIASAHRGARVLAPPPDPLTSSELDLIRREYADAARFLWVNSGMRLWVDFRIQVDARPQRWGPEPAEVGAAYRAWPLCRSYAGEDFRAPGGGEFTFVVANSPETERRSPLDLPPDSECQIEQAFVRRWNDRKRRWELYPSGGGTLGVDDLPGGTPARSQFLAGSDTAWLAAHEFHHQIESMGAHALTRREDDRIVFGHHEPRTRVMRPDGSVSETVWNSSGPHGEHWDALAYWLRTITPAQWLRWSFGETVTVKDADEDGFPDDDPRLPLDERRFGSSASAPATDGAMPDLRKVMLSTWAPSCLQPSWTKPEPVRRLPIATRTDSDGDGAPDGVDPFPLEPWPPFVWRRRIEVDGDPADWESVPLAGKFVKDDKALEVRQAHDDSAYYGLLAIRGPIERLYLTLDGESEGYYSGKGVQALEVVKDGGYRVRPVEVAGSTARAPGLKWKARRGRDGGTTIEFSLPNRGEGIWFWRGAGREIGLSLDLFDVRGSGWSLYEPYRPFRARMIDR